MRKYLKSFHGVFATAAVLIRTIVNRPLAHSHAKVNVTATSTSDSCVRVLLLKYAKLVAEGEHLLIDLFFLLF